MHYLRLIGHFARASFQEEAAYRANFFISLMVSLLNLATGAIGIAVLFGQLSSSTGDPTINGWNFTSTLALLGVYFIVGSLRGLVFGPSLEALAGMDGDVWSGRMDFTLIRPLSTQFLASFRKWRLYALFDLLLGVGVLVTAVVQLNQTLSLSRLLAFLLALGCGIAILYAILLAFSALVFWSPGVLFTWVFDGVMQMARYPLGLYPGWLRMVLTWVIPVGIITTLPAQALSGVASPWALAGMLLLATVFTLASSLLFRYGVRQYKSASS